MPKLVFEPIRAVLVGLMTTFPLALGKYITLVAHFNMPWDTAFVLTGEYILIIHGLSWIIIFIAVWGFNHFFAKN